MTTMLTTVEPTGAERARLEAVRGLTRVDRLYTVEGIEVRAGDDPDSTIKDFYGHATVYGKGYDMYGGPDKGGWTEYVDKGAGKKTLSEKPDVALKLNHEGMTLARTKSGTLQLAEDDSGLEARAQLDIRQSVVNDIVIAMERGDLDEMSFAFRVMKQKWLNRDGEEVPWWDLTGVERHITEYNIHKGDVSIVNFGASPHTNASLRSLDEAVRELLAGREPADEAELRAAIGHLTSLLPTARASDGDAELEAAKVEFELRARLRAQAAV